MLAIEHAQHGVLAKQVGHDRNAKVDVAFIDDNLEPPVLRHPPLGDVEFGNDLHPGDCLVRDFNVVDLLDDLQHTIKAVLDHHAASLSLEVDVARPGAQGVVQRRVDKTDHGALGGVDVGDRDLEPGIGRADGP